EERSGERRRPGESGTAPGPAAQGRGSQRLFGAGGEPGSPEPGGEDRARSRAWDSGKDRRGDRHPRGRSPHGALLAVTLQRPGHGLFSEAGSDEGDWRPQGVPQAGSQPGFGPHPLGSVGKAVKPRGKRPERRPKHRPTATPAVEGARRASPPKPREK